MEEVRMFLLACLLGPVPIFLPSLVSKILQQGGCNIRILSEKRETALLYN